MIMSMSSMRTSEKVGEVQKQRTELKVVKDRVI